MAVSESWWGGSVQRAIRWSDQFSLTPANTLVWYGMVWYGTSQHPPLSGPVTGIQSKFILTFGFLSHLIVYQSHQEFNLGVVFLTSSSCVFCLLALIDWIWILISKGASVAFPLKRIRTIESAFCQDSQHHTFHFLCFSKSIWASKVHFKINQT